MALNKPGKKILKVTGIILGILLVLLTAFHFWFKAHARQLIEQLVESKSHGKLKLEMEKFRFSYFSKNMELDNAVFYNTDTANENTSYRFRVAKIKLRVNAVLPILFKKQFLIDSLFLNDPDITVTRLRSSVKTDTLRKKDISIPEEMGKIYKSIQDGLQVLKVKRFEINNCKFTLRNNIRPDEMPVTITNLYFHLDNIEVDTSRFTIDKRFLFSDNLVLRTRNQDIQFPDGRHRLSFSRFRINVRKKLVEFDSCTISSSKSETSSASFNVFFDALLLTNIDFDTLYRHDVIKADSVYCLNPKFKLDVEIGKANGPKKQAPRLDKIIQQLTGDLQLGFVIVNNADFDINTIRDGHPSSFTFTRNNFELQGLSITDDEKRPLKIKTFAMAIRNYENFLRDSSYALQFDSILFNNNRIFLSNFSLRQFNKGQVINSFSMPQFELMGLSWDDLLFERKLRAQEATLYHPLINYSIAANPSQKNKNQDIFQSLAGLSTLMKLENFDIWEGEINLKLAGGGEMHLENATMSVLSRTLLHSKKIEELKHSVNTLSFAKGSIRLNDLNAQLGQVEYRGANGQLKAGTIQVGGKEKDWRASAKNVIIDEVILDSTEKTMFVNGIQWKEADLKFSIPKPTAKQKNNGLSFVLKNINGHDTRIETTIGEKSVTGFLQQVLADAIETGSGNKPQIINLSVVGKNIKAADKSSRLFIESLRLADKKPTAFGMISYTSVTNKDSVAATIPSLSLVPDINELIQGPVKLRDVQLIQPSLTLQLSSRNRDSAIEHKESKFPDISINSFSLQQPRIYFQLAGKKGTTRMEWNGPAGNNSVQAEDIQFTNHSSPAASIKKISLALDHFLFSGKKGKTFDAGEGKIVAQLNNLSLQQADTGTWNWNGIVTSLEAKKFLLDSLGKTSGRLVINNASLKNLDLSSAYAGSIKQAVTANTGFQLKQFDGHYQDRNTYMQWYNAGFDRNSRALTLDSFRFEPAEGQDSFMAKQLFQNDYIKVRTGAIKIGPVDLKRYINDSILSVGLVSVDKVMMTDYRDNRLPFKAGFIKPLPANLVKKIPIRFSADSILLDSSTIEYTEVGAKTKEAGSLLLTGMTARIFPVRNYDLSSTDSLRIQINANLMDSAWIRLRFRESYTDSLAGFLLTVRMKPTDILILNPVLIPLSSVKLQSGYLDTISMRAAGQEYLSYGEMKMYYHDLKIKFLKDGSETKRTFLTSLITFVANSFVVRNKNNSRTGTVFYIRDQERSAVNYIIKIAMSGIASSVGAKSNHKLIRKYRKIIRLRNLPPLDYD